MLRILSEDTLRRRHIHEEYSVNNFKNIQTYREEGNDRTWGNKSQAPLHLRSRLFRSNQLLSTLRLRLCNNTLCMEYLWCRLFHRYGKSYRCIRSLKMRKKKISVVCRFISRVSRIFQDRGH